MAYLRINRNIHFSSFKIVYGYKPEVVKSTKGLKLIEPKDIPRIEDISLELQLVYKIAKS